VCSPEGSRNPASPGVDGQIVTGPFCRFYRGIGPTIWRAGVSESSDQAGSRLHSNILFTWR
jgi:hypothetical protein